MPTFIGCSVRIAGMSDRTICGGGKGGGSAYDPQIGRAASQTAQTAQEALDWSKDYYANVITPMLKQQSEASVKAQNQMTDLYGIQSEQARLGAERYKEYGIPAENKYYQMAQQYSEPAEYERQAALAKGDLETAQAGEMASATRQMGALGINPASPAFASAMADKLLAEGIYVTGFSFPVVPKGQARIRTQISAAHTKEQLDTAIAAFTRIGKEMGVI